ncbi:peptide ABC transporter ATPase (plasmid) [Halostagnicola larsenii XH-48]|uniref:Nickel import system ATP-binding protein NikD n=1 Tax=Halostagnicola larsenii XH-48 TaxID=797299 RepID=W0JX26_9EURY|nr:ABC transporter ATP-binding protein [Halostagnicola larsenii]AHG01374.1 peptide ABC transporter ATPase [Halostagnicola larsenii XH-48]AHG01832.1 peptide ABC transporter ATPase [Halostagnicola larsenii XH-48]
MSKTDPIVEVRDLDVTFQMNRGQSRVVRDADIDVFRNETLGIIGESGSGKSMLASSFLNAVVEPGVSTGDVTYYSHDGEPTNVLELSESELDRFRWEEVAMVFQGAMSSFNPVLKIRTHFRETLQDHNRDVGAGMQRARELLESVYLDPDRILDSYAHELSGGMKQRALIALSLVLEPELLVLDEPTAALDLLMQRSIVTLLEQLQDEYDLTLVFITHDLPLLTKLADRIAVMYAFNIIEIATTEDILYDASHPYTRALLDTTPDLNVPVEEMNIIEGSKPDPVDQIPGCSYHPRCPMADSQCRAEEPPMLAVRDGHESACFYHDQAAEAVPISAAPDTRPATSKNAATDGGDN